MSSFIAPPPSHVTSGPSMQEILFSSSAPQVASSEWQTESRAQFCTYVVTPRPVPSTMVPTPFGMAMSVPQPTPPQYPLVGNWMHAPVQDGPAAYSHAQQMVATQPEQQALQQQQQQQPSLEPASASENADKPAADSSASGGATEQAKPAAASRFPRSKSPKGRKPPFHTYGRANTKPTAGGFMYGDYLATHNAVACRTIPRSKRPTAVEMGGAQVHYMEHDMRQSHMRSAHYQSPSHEEPSPAPATSKDKHRAEVKAAAAQAKTEAATSASAVASQPPPEAPAAGGAPACAEQFYAALPAYNPSSYVAPSAQLPGAVPYLPYYPVPLEATKPEQMAAAYHAAPGCYAYAAAGPPQPPQPAQQLMSHFVPDELGARLDPRRFKFAPRFAMASVMPAGLRSVRRDNLLVA